MRFLSSLILLSVVGGCTQDVKAPVTDDFTDLQGMDEKSDAFSYRMKTLGTLTYGQTSSAKAYSSTPRFRAFKFDGNANDRVDAWVRSTDGDAVAWLLDKSFNVLASNDDANANTLDAHVVFTLPASTSTTHYLVFRDYDLVSSHFTVQLGGGPQYDTTCHTDSDCVAVSRGGCCPNGVKVAVTAGSEGAYAAASVCTITPHPVCPFAVILDRRVAQCNFATNRCEMIAAEDIKCGGFIATTHHCPDGYSCQLTISTPDLPGRCVAP
jgi:hypothetical protein